MASYALLKVHLPTAKCLLGKKIKIHLPCGRKGVLGIYMALDRVFILKLGRPALVQATPPNGGWRDEIGHSGWKARSSSAHLALLKSKCPATCRAKAVAKKREGKIFHVYLFSPLEWLLPSDSCAWQCLAIKENSISSGRSSVFWYAAI